jgi:hypothetical protein
MLGAYEPLVNSRCAGPEIGRFPTLSARLSALQPIRQLFISFPRIRQLWDSRFTGGFRFASLKQSGRCETPVLIYPLFLRSLVFCLINELVLTDPWHHTAQFRSNRFNLMS